MDKLIGYFSIFIGLVWIVRPQVLRWWLVGKASWALYWTLVLYLFFPVASLIERWGAKGWICLAIGLVVFGGLLRGFIKKLAERLPLVSFQVIGTLTLLSGIFMAFFKKP